jgi:hypothetical protein
MEQYTTSSGPAYSGIQICCDGQDVRVSASDCGDGENHWAEAAGTNCAVGYEGEDNYGSACAQVVCERMVCAVGVTAPDPEEPPQ